MHRLSRRLALAGLAIAGGEAAAMPQQLWHGATHFSLDCRVQKISSGEAALLCARLAPIISNSLQLAFRQTPGPNDIVLKLDLRHEGDRLAGTLVAVRPALRGETDERSANVPVSLDVADPKSGLNEAIALMGKPVLRHRPRRMRPAA